MRKMPFVFLFFMFASGVVMSSFFRFDLSFLLLILLLVTGILLFGIKWKLTNFPIIRKVFAHVPLLLFFILGFFTSSLHENKAQIGHFENNYLKGDQALVEVKVIANAKSRFRKAEVEVRQLIRYRDTLNVHGKLLVFIEDSLSKIQRKEVLFVRGDFQAITNANNPGEFDANSYWKNKGINRNLFLTKADFLRIGKVPFVWSDLFVDLRNFFAKSIDEHVSIESAGIAKALILGDRSSLDGEITRKFGNTGAMHVLAVSGLHVGILVTILQAFLGFFPTVFSKKKALLFALILVWIYAFTTGLSASVVRSAFMFSVLAGSTLFEKDYNPFNSLAFSAVILLIWNPAFLFDIGFQLSYLAMLGIFLFFTPLSKQLFIKNKWIRSAYDGTVLGIAAQITTVPLTLYYFHQFPNYFMLTNLFLMVLAFAILAIGLAFFVVAKIPVVGKYVGMLLSVVIALMLYIISQIDQLPGAVASGFVLSPIQVFLFFLLIATFAATLHLKKLKLLSFTLIFAVLFSANLIYSRWNRMNMQEICFLNNTRNAFIVKDSDQLFCFYSDKNKATHKVKFNAEAYQKVYPGKMTYIEISQKKKSVLTRNKLKVEIEKQRGGFAILVNQKEFHLVNREDYDPKTGVKIYAPWLPSMQKNALSKGAIQFPI